MATIIKLKRGTSTPTTSDLANGEVGIDTSAKKLYINDSGTIKLIGGSGSGGVVGATVLGGDVRGYTGDGSTVAFTVSDGADVENVLVFLNGVYQRPTTDYTVSSTTLTFGTAPVSGDIITIKELVEGGTSIKIVDDSSTETQLLSGESLKVTGSGGVTTSLTGDTLTIAGAASLAVQDEGSALSTSATTLNFVGSGVTASGSGATKTITIPGGGGDVFKNIAMPDGSTVVAADSATDTLTLAQSGLVSITGNSGTDTVTIGTPNAAQIPFLKADGSSSDIDLQTSGAISDILSNLHIPFTKADGSSVTTLVVA
tara:strand:+ start:21 stop:962 length:942 start_codon:yes stop_codon:yes gene_type:complete